MSRIASVVSLIAITSALLACGSSPPTRFYTLNSVPAEVPRQHEVGPPVKVDAVHVPALLDRESIVRGESGNQLVISGQDRWGGDFGEMARRVLTQDLRARLPAESVIPAEAPAPANARGLVVDILSFSPAASGEVVLDADWTVLQGEPAQPVIRRAAHLEAPAATSAADEVATMSRLLGQLADQIASGIGAPSQRPRHPESSTS